jgi:hypothetical protein
MLEKKLEDLTTFCMDPTTAKADCMKKSGDGGKRTFQNCLEAIQQHQKRGGSLSGDQPQHLYR